MRPPTVSIIVPTFNSELTLTKVLTSIGKQSYPTEKIEVIVVDGGSNDNTIKIAKKHYCKIVNNPKTEPIAGKCLGYSIAKGRYIVFLDADEEIRETESIETKVNLLLKNKSIKAVSGSGYENPKKSSFITKYINEFGDPFSFFIYRSSKNNKYFLDKMSNTYPIIKKTKKYIVYDFSKFKKFPIIELGAANSMVDASYLKSKFPKFTHEVFTHMFYMLIKHGNIVAFTIEDPVIHHTSTTYRKYLQKIIWRVRNNIHHKSILGNAGFSGRESYSTEKKFMKYLFIPYAFTVIVPIIDSIVLIYKRKDLSYVFHTPLSVFTATAILYNYVLKIFGFKPVLKSYDGKIELKSDE